MTESAPPQPADAQAVGPPIKSTSDLRLEEWKECRAIVGRMDQLLEDLRKYGFSLVTVLLTATGIATAVVSGRPFSPLASLAVMVLVGALYGVDTYYTTALAGAVDRALVLETVIEPRMYVTWYVRVAVTRAKSLRLTAALYLMLLLTAFGLGLVGW